MVVYDMNTGMWMPYRGKYIEQYNRLYAGCRLLYISVNDDYCQENCFSNKIVTLHYLLIGHGPIVMSTLCYVI